MSDADTPLQRAIRAAKGVANLARTIGTSTQNISQWKRVPAERCIAVEQATGGAVTRYELRPDVFGHPPNALAETERRAAGKEAA